MARFDLSDFEWSVIEPRGAYRALMTGGCVQSPLLDADPGCRFKSD
jgi:hypothetical protein